MPDCRRKVVASCAEDACAASADSRAETGKNRASAKRGACWASQGLVGVEHLPPAAVHVGLGERKGHRLDPLRKLVQKLQLPAGERAAGVDHHEQRRGVGSRLGGSFAVHAMQSPDPGRINQAQTFQQRNRCGHLHEARGWHAVGQLAVRRDPRAQVAHGDRHGGPVVGKAGAGRPFTAVLDHQVGRRGCRRVHR